MLQAELGACAPRVSGVELESLISSVKDLLPDLGEGFIQVSEETPPGEEGMFSLFQLERGSKGFTGRD